MKVFRVKKDKNFTTINNTIFKDQRISCKSKGFFATIMTLPDDWDFSINGMKSILIEGKTSIYSCIDELEEFGYVIKNKKRNENGRIAGFEYIFRETPINTDVTPHSGFPEMDNPEMENQPQLNTKYNKELNNKTNMSDDSIDWSALLVFFNKTTGNKSRVVNDKVKKQFRARLKEGYTKEDIMNAIINCHKDPFHKSNPHFLTLEFISRADKLEKYSNYKPKVVRLPDDWFHRELTPEQRELLTPERLSLWKRNKSAVEIEGGRLKPIEV